MAGAKSETEIITISTNFSFVSNDTDEGIFNVSLLDSDFCLEYLIFLEVLRYILCRIALNVAAVTNNYLYIWWLLQCVMDLTMLLSAFYLFIELLTVKENVLYMSFNAI